LSRSAASYYARNDIRVNVIAPGLVETPMAQRAAENGEIMDFIRTKQPLSGGRVGFPGDYDGAAVFLLSDEASFMTGQTVVIGGGWTLSEGQFPDREKGG
jgi:NAD(P)-dependent dehydrogenase (short-subunit alcohol dehydrogenase family)